MIHLAQKQGCALLLAFTGPVFQVSLLFLLSQRECVVILPFTSMSPKHLANSSDYHLSGSEVGIYSSCSRSYKELRFSLFAVIQVLSSKKRRQGQGTSPATAKMHWKSDLHNYIWWQSCCEPQSL